jgi:hypothetical protein
MWHANGKIIIRWFAKFADALYFQKKLSRAFLSKAGYPIWYSFPRVLVAVFFTALILSAFFLIIGHWIEWLPRKLRNSYHSEVLKDKYFVIMKPNLVEMKIDKEPNKSVARYYFYQIFDINCEFKAEFKPYNNKGLLNSALSCGDRVCSIFNPFLEGWRINTQTSQPFLSCLILPFSTKGALKC